ncbi:hypothetical protein, partial [Salmonella sp. gx-f5]|uniref:hypothetical protein n=1 Tax=Salmonella sp. gx-f5 TaxID=2582605 RepID=UPI001F17F499
PTFPACDYFSALRYAISKCREKKIYTFYSLFFFLSSTQTNFPLSQDLVLLQSSFIPLLSFVLLHFCIAFGANNYMMR